MLVVISILIRFLYKRNATYEILSATLHYCTERLALRCLNWSDKGVFKSLTFADHIVELNMDMIRLRCCDIVKHTIFLRQPARVNIIGSSQQRHLPNM